MESQLLRFGITYYKILITSEWVHKEEKLNDNQLPFNDEISWAVLHVRQ